MIYPKLTKQYITDECNISEFKIIEKYLNIPIKEGKYICNPLRDDSYPTCMVTTLNDGRTRFTDFSGIPTGRYVNGKYRISWDCYDLVEYIINTEEGGGILKYTSHAGEEKNKRINLDINSHIILQAGKAKVKLSSFSFNYVLHHIAKKFKLHIYSNDNITISTGGTTKILNTKKLITKKLTKIECKFRQYVKHDYTYWNIRSKKDIIELKQLNIHAVKYAWVNGNLIYSYSTKDRCYAYYRGKDSNKDNLFKLYFVDRATFRFATNSQIFNFRTILPSHTGIITKSLKDVYFGLKLKILDSQLGLINVDNENHVITKKEWYSIKYYCDNWLTLFDFDYTGVRLAIIYYIEYNIEPIFFINKDSLGVKTINNIEHSVVWLLVKEFGKEIVLRILKRKTFYKFEGKDLTDNYKILGKSVLQAIGNKYLNNLIFTKWKVFITEE